MAIEQPSEPRQTSVLARQRHADTREQIDNGRRRRRSPVTTGLGIFSVGLGLAEIAAHQGVARLIGVKDRPSLLPLLGLREITSGIGILSQRRPANWVSSRVGGDVIDLALMALAMRDRGTRRSRLAAATAAVAGVTALDYWWSKRLRDGDAGSATVLPRDEAIRIERSITVNRPVEECYRFWRNFENLPRFMKHLEAVQILDDRRSHWVAKGPAGTTVEWDAEIINEEPNEVIAWRSIENPTVESTGAVRFEAGAGGRGTIVRLKMHYRPPGGVLGAAVAKLFGEEPEQQINDDFRRFKQVMETGEIPTTEGQSHGRRGNAMLRSVKGS